MAHELTFQTRFHQPECNQYSFADAAMKVAMEEDPTASIQCSQVPQVRSYETKIPNNLSRRVGIGDHAYSFCYHMNRYNGTDRPEQKKSNLGWFWEEQKKM